ncbi:DUF4011 domain-containing protein [Hymenobacter sp. J193]|uniref:DUF4011 domain-containing protein n=1 Tax=Hymenobacter sp. J193 TaxID=2898429 RepID=UPI002151DB19|nr:DUF4011 domain-containing protein [Hymenobacter sp. J193]
MMPADATLAARLEASRQELLDLGLRNPLLNFRSSPARGVTVVREQSAQVFDRLVRQGKTMYFAPAPEPDKPTLLAAPLPTETGVVASEATNPVAADGGAAQRERSNSASSERPSSGSPLSTGEGGGG